MIKHVFAFVCVFSSDSSWHTWNTNITSSLTRFIKSSYFSYLLFEILHLISNLKSFTKQSGTMFIIYSSSFIPHHHLFLVHLFLIIKPSLYTQNCRHPLRYDNLCDDDPLIYGYQYTPEEKQVQVPFQT